MTLHDERPTASPLRSAPRVLLTDRGDPLVAALSAALAQRFDVVGRVDAELTSSERVLVGASTFRPSRAAWVERFHKSNLGVALRSRRVRTGLSTTGREADVVFQTHALFATSDDRTVMYVDCTHQQVIDQWPRWNPLRGRALRRWLARERQQYHGAAHVFAFCEETARSLVEQYAVPEARVTVVGAGVGFAGMPPRTAARSGPPTILFVGNDFARKGGTELLEAFDVLRRRVPDARLRIVGTRHRIPARPGVEQLGRIHDRDRLSELYATADVFCLPSFFDPFPGALLEAMAHGLPAVVTSTCGVPEIVEMGVTALGVSRGPAMVPELAAALEELLLDPARALRMGELARRRAEERFLWSHVVDRMTPVVKRLAAAPTPAPAGECP